MATPTSRRFLVTAGNTRERIDQVRNWGNIFTGNTGFSIARALRPLGHVDLLTSNPAHVEQAGAEGIAAQRFGTHAELRAALEALVLAQPYDAVFMTAAVADYRPAGVFAIIDRQPEPGGGERWIVRNVQAGKVSSAHPAIAVVGEPTEKLVDLFRTTWGHRGLLVKFKLEVGRATPELLEIGEKSRQASGADYLVANTLEMVQGESPGAYLIGATGSEWIPRADLARRMATLAGG